MKEEFESELLPYLYWLLTTPGFGDVTVIKLLDFYHDIRKLFYASEEEILFLEEVGIISKSQRESLLVSRLKGDIYSPFKKVKEAGIQMIPITNILYPSKLKNIPDPPAVLFVKGNLPTAKEPTLAIVGTRDISQYGKRMAQYFGEEMAKAGVSVISGMARGVDGIAELSALNKGGKSYGVLGCGVDICYPKQNIELYTKLSKYGGLISSYIPGTPPTPSLFPARNRIISGLSDGVLVIEARIKSGSKITVDMALEQGRDVFAVPGRVDDPMSEGTNDLIKQGAGIADCAGTVLEALFKSKESRSEKVKSSFNRIEIIKEKLNENQYKILALLDDYPTSLEDIFIETEESGLSLTISKLRTILMELCMEGYITDEGGRFSRAI